MKTISRIVAPLALAGTIIPAVLFAFKLIGAGPMKLTLLLATVAWFATAPFWLEGGDR